jgi:signal transduction histidine kinase
VAVPHQDEIGKVAAEFNAMVKELAETRRRLLAEAEARSSLEKGLQRVDKMVTLGQLSAGLAHEIGSPLQILNGRARALSNRADISADVRRTVEILVAQTDRITDIVTQLLNLARRKSAQLGETDVSAATRTIVDLLEPEIKRRSISIEFDAADDLPRILADSDQIQQLALNLLTNALRAAAPGGHLRVTLRSAHFLDRIGEEDRPCVSLVVEDNGVGMDEAVLERIFEPFFTTWGADGGTGLGLAVVKAIVDEHGGTLAVSSKKNTGTCFTVCLPLRGRASNHEMVA